MGITDTSIMEEQDDDENSNASSKISQASSRMSGTVFPSMNGGIPVTSHSPRKGNQGGQRGKYKQKSFSCPHCGKGYSDANRLKTHVETKHLQTNDPWRNVGPNTDIAIRSPRVQSGYEVYKVLGVYSTGLRFKCARFAPLDQNKWVLTEEINKNIQKPTIAMILKTLTKEEGGIYRIDTEELISLLKIISDEKPLRGVVNTSLNSSIEYVNGDLENSDNENGGEVVEGDGDEGEEENGEEVMVQPVFEEEADIDMEVD